MQSSRQLMSDMNLRRTHHPVLNQGLAVSLFHWSFSKVTFMSYYCKMIPLPAERADWSLNQTLTLTGVALIFPSQYLYWDNFELKSYSNAFLQKECLTSGSSEPRNIVEIFAFIADLAFLPFYPCFLTFICCPKFYYYNARVNGSGKRSEAESSWILTPWRGSSNINILLQRNPIQSPTRNQNILW